MGTGGISAVAWLTFGPEMSLVRDGMPDTAPMILYDKSQTILQSASYLLSDLVVSSTDDLATRTGRPARLHLFPDFPLYH